MKKGNEELRRIVLNAQGLTHEKFGKGKKGTLNAIRHLGYVQLDTLAVVARAHHHILWSRVGDHKEKYLDDLMREKKIFEYWSHAAAFLPMDDFRFSMIRKEEYRKGKRHWFRRDKKMHRFVFDRIKAEGAMRAIDFENDRSRGSWWDWKPAKIALEQLFLDGTLMVKERKGFQKVYDLTERILPAGIDTSVPSKEEYARYLIVTNLRAHGIASVMDMTHLRQGIKAEVEKQLRRMLKEGEIVDLNITGVKDKYFFSGDWEQGASNKEQGKGSVKILSPFDNAIIRRDRVMDLFGYDFRVEFYLPEPKRKFGYFCLPVLWKNEFVARFDPKADRASKTFHVKKFHLEKKMNKKEKSEFMDEFGKTLKEFAKFNGCNEIAR